MGNAQHFLDIEGWRRAVEDRKEWRQKLRDAKANAVEEEERDYLSVFMIKYAIYVINVELKFN